MRIGLKNLVNGVNRALAYDNPENQDSPLIPKTRLT